MEIYYSNAINHYKLILSRICVIAEILGITANTVSSIHIRYKEEGLNGIPDKSMPGRPSRLTEEQMISLRAVILYKLPEDVGFPAEFNWTAGLLGKYIKREYGVQKVSLF